MLQNKYLVKNKNTLYVRLLVFPSVRKPIRRTVIFSATIFLDDTLHKDYQVWNLLSVHTTKTYLYMKVSWFSSSIPFSFIWPLNVTLLYNSLCPCIYDFLCFDTYVCCHPLILFCLLRTFWKWKKYIYIIILAIQHSY